MSDFSCPDSVSEGSIGRCASTDVLFCTVACLATGEFVAFRRTPLAVGVTFATSPDEVFETLVILLRVRGDVTVGENCRFGRDIDCTGVSNGAVLGIGVIGLSNLIKLTFKKDLSFSL